MPGRTRPTMAQAGRAGDILFKAGEKEAETSWQKIKTPPQNIRTSGKGSLQTATPMAALRALPSLQW